MFRLLLMLSGLLIRFIIISIAFTYFYFLLMQRFAIQQWGFDISLGEHWLLVIRSLSKGWDVGASLESAFLAFFSVCLIPFWAAGLWGALKFKWGRFFIENVLRFFYKDPENNHKFKKLRSFHEKNPHQAFKIPLKTNKPSSLNFNQPKLEINDADLAKLQKTLESEPLANDIPQIKNIKTIQELAEESLKIKNNFDDDIKPEIDLSSSIKDIKLMNDGWNENKDKDKDKE